MAGIVHHPGEASGLSLVLEEPLSLWGGVDPLTGAITDQHHPQLGESIAGSVLVLPHGRGSSGGSGVLAECLRGGVGPAAIVMRELDSILLIGALVAEELYGIVCPIVEVGRGYDELESGVATRLFADGRLEQRA